MIEFLTTGLIAKKLGVDRDEVSYAILATKTKPVGQAGHVRVFSESALKLVKEFLETKGSQNNRIS